MGRAAAEKIVEAGWKVVVFDVSEAALKRAEGVGAVAAASPAGVMRQVHLTLLFLPGPTEVKNCVAGPEGLLSSAREGSVIVDMSTVEPGGTRRLAEVAGKKGVGYLDAPVLGRPLSVGNWALPVGGEASYLEVARPVLELVANRIFHIGPPGSGNQVKLLNQLMFGAINAMTAEMMAIAEKIGISPKVLYKTITASQAGTVSNLFKELGARIAENNYDDPTFTVDLLVKDIMLAVQMAKSGQAPPILAQTVVLINEISQAQGLGNKDTSIMWKSFRRLWQNVRHDSDPE